jgi:hypothetical protein
MTSAIEYIVNFHAQSDTLIKMEGDDQSQQLFADVMNSLAKVMELTPGQMEALNRMVQVVENRGKWAPDLVRNNVFKAANALGMKLPSHAW